MRQSVSCQILLCSAVFAAGGFHMGRHAAAQESAATVSPDEQQIRAAATRYVEHFNRRDAKGLANLFTPDAEFVYADGTKLVGREALEISFDQAFQENPQAQLSLSVDAIRFVAPTAAIETGMSTMFRDGETPTYHTRYTVMHVKRDGQWQIAGGRTEMDEVLSNYEHLRHLEWIVGDWIDEGADAVIETSTHWSPDKNYLLQDFSVIARGEVLLTGTQRIGWDPRTNQLRSWVFDAEGGFGESTWTKANDHWIVKTTGVHKDGTPVSHTRTLVPVTADRVTVTMTDRLHGDESLPDLAVTMVRKAPTPRK